MMPPQGRVEDAELLVADSNHRLTDLDSRLKQAAIDNDSAHARAEHAELVVSRLEADLSDAVHRAQVRRLHICAHVRSGGLSVLFCDSALAVRMPGRMHFAAVVGCRGACG